jgi:hypothetical protein
LTPSAIHALQQALKKKIHVTHTGHVPTPATQTTGKPLRPRASNLPAYNNIGISDANTRATANFDGSYRSYSAQALQDVGLVPGITVTSQNIIYIWPAVSVGQPDNYAAAGQVIPLAALPGAATIGILGASTAGSSSGTATLTYTDGSTSTFTLGLTDWWNGTPAFGNQQVVHMTTINTKHGTKSGNFYLYSLIASVNPSKTLQSVTLPTTTLPGVLHVFAVGIGGPAFNNTGISDDGSPGSANYDGGGASLSAQALASADLVPGHQFDSDGIAYTWPSAASGTPDNYQANGQTLPVVPVPNATTLGLLGSAAGGGNSTGTATLTYTDGSTQTFSLGLSDWTNGTPLYGNTIVASMSYYNRSSGKQTRNIYLYTSEVSLTPGKTLQSVTLPTTTTPAQIHIFAVGTRSTLNNLGTSNDSQSGEGNFDGAGASWSIQALAAAGVQQGQPFVFNGTTFTWPASYGSLADNDQSAGQVLTITPVANATTLGFLGAAAYGPASGAATITYTDGSTQTFTLAFSDWTLNGGTAKVIAGNSIAVQMSYRNQPSGKQSVTTYVFYTEVALQAGKTVQSVTLPSSVSAGQLHVVTVGTRSQYNNIGISDNSAPASANFDGLGNSYSAGDFADPTIAGWNPGDTLTYEGINYIWPGVPAGQGDNYQANGQTIPVTAPAGATTLGFVGAADNAFPTSSGTASLTYTDGSTSTFTLGLTDWTLNRSTGTPYPGNRLFALLPHLNTPQGTVALNSYLFEVETPLNASKTLQSVTLPSSVSQGHLHIFMLGTRTGENYPNNIGTSDDSDTLFANYDGAGNSYSIQALEGQGLNEGQPFTFSGVTFNWPASYSVIPDNYQAAGQVIPSAQIAGPVTGATTLAFLGSATYGPASGAATITYTDGSTQTFTLGFSDWTLNGGTSQPSFGNSIGVTVSYRNTPSGPQTVKTYVFYANVTVQAGKTIQSVTLPATVSQGALHVFAIGTR